MKYLVKGYSFRLPLLSIICAINHLYISMKWCVKFDFIRKWP